MADQIAQLRTDVTALQTAVTGIIQLVADLRAQIAAGNTVDIADVLTQLEGMTGAVVAAEQPPSTVPPTA